MKTDTIAIGNDFVDIAIPDDAQSAAGALGLRVIHNLKSEAWIRHVPRGEAEIAVESLRAWGFEVRIIEKASADKPIEPGHQTSR